MNNNPTVEFKAKEYLYDLKNSALENGFKTDERWEVSLVTGDEKIAIENQYYPTIAVQFVPEILTATFKSIKGKLNQSIEESTVVVNKFAPQPHLQYVVAYNPNRLRR